MGSRSAGVGLPKMTLKVGSVPLLAGSIGMVGGCKLCRALRNVQRF